VDLNRNGDLTDPGEKVRAVGENDSTITFKVGIPGDGTATHALQVDFFKASTFQQEERGPWVALLTLAWTRNRSFGAWGDETGMLFFAPRPADAPVLHIDGPLQIGFECHQPLQQKSSGVYELNVGVGTKGLGRGSFAHLKYWNGAVPDGVKPHAVLEFPSPRPGGPPVRVEAVLGQRC
jgi:hypothetical protein